MSERSEDPLDLADALVAQTRASRTEPAENVQLEALALSRKATGR